MTTISHPKGFLQVIDGLYEAEEDQLFRALSHGEAWGADGDWPSWAHEGQIEPEGDWRTWVMMAGRGFGKTRAGAEWIAAAARDPSATLGMSGGAIRIALVAATLDEARRIMVDGASGLLAVAYDAIESWSPTLRRLRFRSGAEATLFSGASPEALRGPEHHLAWCDELAKWEKAGESWDMLQLGLRLGEMPRVLVTTTPRPGPVLRRIMASRGCVTTGGPTRANPHLPQAFKDQVESLYAGTRLGRQELDGELLTDTPGALWTVELLEKCRRPVPVRVERSRDAPAQTPLDFARDEREGEQLRFAKVVIGVDPPSGDGTCGIVACARDATGIAHVLADHSVTARSPEGWARAVADAARIHASTSLSTGSGRALVVAEANQGGKMVQAVLRTADPDLHVKLVTATQGKILRAEPVAHLFEAGKTVLHGRFPALEAELMGMIAGGDYEGPGVSPDRADAMVWALTELMLAKERAEPRIRSL